MRILGHGIDLVDTKRIQGLIERQGENFLKRVFSPQEYAYCAKQKEPAQHFAARFAAKEAFGKALGTGIGASGDLAEVSVEREGTSPPRLRLHGRAHQNFLDFGGKEIFLSLSHDGAFAIASVIITGD